MWILGECWGMFACAVTVSAVLWAYYGVFSLTWVFGWCWITRINSSAFNINFISFFLVYRLKTQHSELSPCWPWSLQVLFFSRLTSLPCSRCKLIAIARGWKSVTRGCPGTGVRILNVTRKDLCMEVTSMWISHGAPPHCPSMLDLYFICLRTRTLY